LLHLVSDLYHTHVNQPSVYVPFDFFQIAQACKPVVQRAGFWGSVRTLARGYEIVMGLLLFTPVAFLAWFPFVSEFQTRMLFNQAFSRGLQISRILGGHRKDRSSRNKE
jgi:callose synthase